MINKLDLLHLTFQRGTVPRKKKYPEFNRTDSSCHSYPVNSITLLVQLIKNHIKMNAPNILNGHGSTFNQMQKLLCNPTKKRETHPHLQLYALHFYNLCP